MFRRKKVSIKIIKQRLKELEEKGYTELTFYQIHDYLYHDRKEPTKKPYILAILIVGFVVVLSYVTNF